MKTYNYIVGISGEGNGFHDNSVVLLKGGKVVFASSEERYTRIKHDPSFPKNTLKDALDIAGIKKSDVSYFASGWPKLSATKLALQFLNKNSLQSGLNFIKNANLSGFAALVKLLIEINIKKVETSLPLEKRIVYDHYLAHAASAYYTSGFDKCLTVIWDGFGTRSDGTLASGAVFECKNGEIKEVGVHPINASIGLFYEAVTNALGFTPAEGEGKTMGLAVYGNPNRFLNKIKKLAPHFNGTKWIASEFWPDQLPAVDLKYKKVFEATEFFNQIAKLIRISNQDVAAACQKIIEDESVKYFKYLFKKYGYSDYALAGGVFLNVKMGKRIKELSTTTGLFVHPHAGDGGLALGAALLAYKEKVGKVPAFKMDDAYWGRAFKDAEILLELKKTKGIIFEKPTNLAQQVAKKIEKGIVVGWFEGREEWGPRALGSRSVLADPRREEIKERINNYLKKREWFMPFAASIMEEKAGKLFKSIDASPFMTMAYDATPYGKKNLVAGIHVDGTGRPQTVNKKVNPLYWQVIYEFEKLTGVPGILNTSFNRHGLPIVHSPKDAIDHLLWGAIDELVIGSYIVKRK